MFAIYFVVSDIGIVNVIVAISLIIIVSAELSISLSVTLFQNHHHIFTDVAAIINAKINIKIILIVIHTMFLSRAIALMETMAFKNRFQWQS